MNTTIELITSLVKYFPVVPFANHPINQIKSATPKMSDHELNNVDSTTLDELLRELPDQLMFFGHQSSFAIVSNDSRASPSYTNLNLLIEGVSGENKFTLEKSAAVSRRAEEARLSLCGTPERQMEIFNEPDLVRFKQLQILATRGNRQFFVISKNYAASTQGKWINV